MISIASLTALINTLPTTLPTEPNQLWWNGSVLCKSLGDGVSIGIYGVSFYDDCVYGESPLPEAIYGQSYYDSSFYGSGVTPSASIYGSAVYGISAYAAGSSSPSAIYGTSTYGTGVYG